MVSSRSRSVAHRHKETGSYYYLKSDGYDMVTLCIDRVEDIARRDQFIMNYTEDDVAAMPCLTRRKMVQNLERLEAVYARELQLREIGQRTIHSYFQPKISQENNNEEMVLSERPSAAHST